MTIIPPRASEPYLTASEPLITRNRGAAVHVHFGSVVGPPLLPGLAGTVMDDQYPVPVHSLDNGFGYSGSRADGTYPADTFEQGGKRGSQRVPDLGR